MNRRKHSGEYDVITPAPDRQLAMDAFAALPDSHPMVGLFELDVTDAVATIERMRLKGERVSLFAFVVRAIAVAISEHPDLNLVRHGKRLVHFDDVDISVPVEVETADGPFPRMTVLRRAQDLSPQQIYQRLAQARERHNQTGELGAEDRWVHRVMRVMSHLPRFARVALARAMMRDAFVIKARAGTTLVTSVSKFATIPGFSFSFITGPRAATVAVGSAVEKPWLHGGTICARSILSVAVMVDHDLVDGAPAARFAKRLQQLIESADGLHTAASAGAHTEGSVVEAVAH